MKTTNQILFFLALLITITAAASSAGMNTRLHSPRLGDRFSAFAIDYIARPDSVEEAIWDLSECEIVPGKITGFIDSFPECPDSWAAVFNGKRHYFAVSDSGISVTGREFPGERTMYATCPTVLPSTMVRENKACGIIRGNGTLYERLNTCVYGSWSTGISGEGTLITPDADTVRNVVRINTVYRLLRVLSPRDSVLTPPDGNRIAECLARYSELQTTITDSRWYVPGYRYPVLMSCITSEPSGLDLWETYYSPLSVLSELFDLDNKELRDSLSLSHGDLAQEANKDNQGRDGIPECNVKNDPGSRTLTVSCTPGNDGDVEFIMADVAGIVYDSFRREGNAGQMMEISIPYSFLPHAGAYVLYINIDGTRFEEKFYY